MSFAVWCVAVEWTLTPRLSSLGYEIGQRILSLILLRNTQAAGGKVSSKLLLNH